MKIKKINIKKYKLLRLYLTKYEVYKKDFFNLSSESLDKLELSFKKVLYIIHQYHVFNKRILFIGFPYSSNKILVTTLLKSNHLFIPKSVWFKGLIGNNKSISVKFKNLIYFKNYLKIKRNPHLIVVFNESKALDIVLEASWLNIPIIVFGDIYDQYFSNIIYLLWGNFIKKKIQSFYQFLIYSILKKKKNKLIKRKYFKKNKKKEWIKRITKPVKKSIYINKKVINKKILKKDLSI